MSTTKYTDLFNEVLPELPGCANALGASTGFPDWIFSRYLDALAAGAKARLMLMQAKPWSNAGQAADYRSQFDAEVANARAEATTALTRAATRTRSQH